MINSPKEVAFNTIGIGKTKSELPIGKMLLLGILAGMFIAFGGVGANTVSATIENASVAKVAGAMVFPCGLAMVLIAGSELFTGNSLILVGALAKKVQISKMLKNWVVVYIGNFIGGSLVAALCYFANQYNLFGNAVAVNTLSVANAKAGMDFVPALVSGILCNILVCIAVWMSFAAKSVAGKIVAIYMPIMTFVLCGFDHSIANMYYLIGGLLAKLNPAYVDAALAAGKSVDNITFANAWANNLIPVTIGNMIGGCAVALVYYLVYIKNNSEEK